MKEDWGDIYQTDIQQTGTQNSQVNGCLMPDPEEGTGRRLEVFHNPETPDDKLSFNEFAIQQLTLYPDKYSWRPYQWKTWLIEVGQRYRQRCLRR